MTNAPLSSSSDTSRNRRSRACWVSSVVVGHTRSLTIPWCCLAGHDRPSAKSSSKVMRSALCWTAQEKTASSLWPDSPTSLVWWTIQAGLTLRSQEATARGTFWSSRTIRRSRTRNDFLLINDVTRVFKGASHVVRSHLGVGIQNLRSGVAACDHAKDVLCHDPSASNGRLSAADVGIDYDTFVLRVRSFNRVVTQTQV